jgi:glutathione S-transferase
MAELKLVIGSKTYSSWSLRPWLLLRYHNVAFREVPIALNQPDTRSRIAEYSPSGKVPVLLNGPEKIWDSLAICEYAAETLKLPAAWPADASLKFQARSLACEMHSSFPDLRSELPMDCRRPPGPQGFSSAAAADIARIREIWKACRSAHARNGDWLFGKFGIVDAFFAPVVLRLHTYAVPVDGVERDYMNTVLHLPALREWLGAAMLEQVGPPPAAVSAQTTQVFPAVVTPPPRAPAPVVAAPAAPVAIPAPVHAAVPARVAAKPKPSAPPPPPAAPASPAAAPASAPSTAHPAGAQVVSNQGGVRVVSNIIPD